VGGFVHLSAPELQIFSLPFSSLSPLQVLVVGVPDADIDAKWGAGGENRVHEKSLAADQFDNDALGDVCILGGAAEVTSWVKAQNPSDWMAAPWASFAPWRCRLVSVVDGECFHAWRNLMDVWLRRRWHQ
jgi:hypothetical protein